VWRITENGKFIKDIITLEDEEINGGSILLKTVIKSGKIVCDSLHYLISGKMQT